MTDFRGDKLIDGNGVAKATTTGVGGAGQERHVRRVRTVHAGMRHAAEHGEVIPVRLQLVEVRRQLVVAPAVFREKPIRQKAKVVANGEHPPRCPGLFRACEHRCHRLQQRQRHGHACSAQKSAAAQRAAVGDVRSLHGWAQRTGLRCGCNAGSNVICRGKVHFE